MFYFYSIKRFVEHGFNRHVYERNTIEMASLCLVRDTIPLSVQLKISSHVEEDSADVISINYGHVKEVMYALICGITVALLGLFCEIGHNKFTLRRIKPLQQRVRIVNITRAIRIIHSA